MPHQFGCENVVATLGTSLTAGHARLLRRYANKIVLIFDSDVAGTEAANRALEIFLAERIDIRIASVPQGKDPCDFVLAAGKEGFEESYKQCCRCDGIQMAAARGKFRRLGYDDAAKGGRRGVFKDGGNGICGRADGYDNQGADNQPACRILLGLSNKEIEAELKKASRQTEQRRQFRSGESESGECRAARRDFLKLLSEN